MTEPSTIAPSCASRACMLVLGGHGHARRTRRPTRALHPLHPPRRVPRSTTRCRARRSSPRARRDAGDAPSSTCGISGNARPIPSASTTGRPHPRRPRTGHEAVGAADLAGHQRRDRAPKSRSTSRRAAARPRRRLQLLDRDGGAPTTPHGSTRPRRAGRRGRPARRGRGPRTACARRGARCAPRRRRRRRGSRSPAGQGGQRSRRRGSSVHRSPRRLVVPPKGR